jgi:uncharacterized protein YndB with AHSA1/START domain
MVQPSERGCLVLADISGYTAYLRDTELEHANDVLADLTDTIVDGLAPPLRLAKLEGDAVFAYVNEIGGSLLLDTLEATYFSFRRRRRDIVQSTTCQCNACSLIPRLDLKFVVHHGEFVRTRVAGGEELTGTDIVVVHRLLKNRVTAESGLTSYVLVTDPCVTQLGLDPATMGLVEHTEAYEDIGEIVGHLLDLEARWREVEESLRVYVPHEEAQFEITDRFPAAPADVWDAYTSPRRRLLWQTDFIRIDQANPLGRTGAGTVNHCIHGKGVIVEEVLDWRPFDYYTHRIAVPMIGPWEMTVEFAAGEDGSTKTTMRARKLRGFRRLLWLVMERPMRKNIAANSRRLRELLEEETARKRPHDQTSMA